MKVVKLPKYDARLQFMPDNLVSNIIGKNKCKRIIQLCHSANLDCYDIYKHYFETDYYEDIPINISDAFFDSDKLMCRNKDSDRQTICNRFYKTCQYTDELKRFCLDEETSNYPLFTADEIVNNFDLDFFSIDHIAGDDYEGDALIENDSKLCCEFTGGKWGILAYFQEDRDMWRWYYNSKSDDTRIDIAITKQSEDNIITFWNKMNNITEHDLSVDERALYRSFIDGDGYSNTGEIFPKIMERDYTYWENLSEPQLSLLQKIGITEQIWKSMLDLPKSKNQILIHAATFEQLVCENIVPCW